LSLYFTSRFAKSAFRISTSRVTGFDLVAFVLPITFELYDVLLASVFRLMPYVPLDQYGVGGDVNVDKIGTGVDFFDQFPHAHPLLRLNPEDHDSVVLNGS